MVPTSQQSLSLEAFWFLSLKVPHPFPTQSLTTVLSVFHVCSSLTFIAHSSPLIHVFVMSYLDCDHTPAILQFMMFTTNREISVLSESDHIIFCSPPKKFFNGFLMSSGYILKVLTSGLSLIFLICHLTLNYTCGEILTMF